MQVEKLRNIESGQQFNGYFPVATAKDSVIRSVANVDDTINLMLHMVSETKADTQKIAQLLKRNTLKETCQAIWDFVYRHIQYKRDKTGIEQVRRPSRSWLDRTQGVDCDCYSVFISSILLNLGIAHRIRITKYNGRANFQHVYPVVINANTQITMDCVTDRFNHEVPYSDHKDFEVTGKTMTENLSGVDVMDLDGISFLSQPRLALRAQHRIGCNQKLRFTCYPAQRRVQPSQLKKTKQTEKHIRSTGRAHVKSPFSNESETKLFKGKQLKSGSNTSELLFKTALVLGVGYGAYQLFGFKKSKKLKKKTKTIQ